MSVSSQATSLQPGQSVSGTLPTWNDRNDYAVDVQAGYSYAVTITELSSIIHVTLVDASGADAPRSVAHYGFWSEGLPGYSGPNTYGTVAATPVAPPGSGSFTEIFTAISTGTVYLQLDGSYFGAVYVGQPTPPAAYTVVLGAPDDIGATPPTAGQLAIGGTVNGKFDVQNDIDEYAVTLQAGKTYEFDDVSNTQFEMTLFGADRSFYLAHWSPFYPALTYTPAQTGTYYLDVSTLAGTGIAPYTIGAKLLAPTTEPGTGTPTPVPVHRLYDATTGAQLLTADATEASTLLATKSNWIDQGLGP